MPEIIIEQNQDVIFAKMPLSPNRCFKGIFYVAGRYMSCDKDFT